MRFAAKLVAVIQDASGRRAGDPYYATRRRAAAMTEHNPVGSWKTVRD